MNEIWDFSNDPQHKNNTICISSSLKYNIQNQIYIFGHLI